MKNYYKVQGRIKSEWRDIIGQNHKRLDLAIKEVEIYEEARGLYPDMMWEGFRILLVSEEVVFK